MLPTLPLPSPEQLREFARDPEAAASVDRIRRRLVGQVKLLTDDVILAVALARAPDSTPAAATAALETAIDGILNVVVTAGALIAEVKASNTRALAPLVGEAARRVLDGHRRMEEITSILERQSADTAANAKRATLKAAGVSGDDLERLAAKPDLGPLRNERDALQAAIEPLERFLKSRDTSHLPTGFAVREPLKVEVALPPMDLDQFRLVGSKR